MSRVILTALSLSAVWSSASIGATFRLASIFNAEDATCQKNALALTCSWENIVSLEELQRITQESTLDVRVALKTKVPVLSKIQLSCGDLVLASTKNLLAGSAFDKFLVDQSAAESCKSGLSVKAQWYGPLIDASRVEIAEVILTSNE